MTHLRYLFLFLLSLVRDFCISMYTSYPAEAEDGFERALAESRLEE